MPICFVIQPFDDGPFDKRYDDVIEPAIGAADLEAYRVDRDPGTVVVIEEIESRIREAEACVADITTDNPNVWFEVGYAIACKKDLVMICQDPRPAPFPFDVRHRTILRYRTDAPSDFDDLKSSIYSRLVALKSKATTLERIADSPLPATKGLGPHEIALLAVLMESGLDPENPPGSWSIYQDMERAGFTKVAAAIATKRLIREGFVRALSASNQNGDFTAFGLTDFGEAWLLDNQDQVVLRKPQTAVDDGVLPF